MRARGREPMLGGDLSEGIGRQVPGTFQGLEAWPPGSWSVRRCGCLVARGGVCAGTSRDGPKN